MRFSYVKSDVGEIVITVAYEEKKGKTYYGVSCISPDEKYSNKREGKSRAMSRCHQAVLKDFDFSRSIIWKPYFVNGVQDLRRRNKLVNYCETKGFDKLGAKKTEGFIDELKSLKQI